MWIGLACDVSGKQQRRLRPRQANTPAEIIEKLNKEINAGLADPKIKAKFSDLGAIPMPFTPAEFGVLIAAETEKWAKVIKFAGIKPE
jgi:tripartite-type tricarboxylate transporter receptor subunit TctC